MTQTDFEIQPSLASRTAEPAGPGLIGEAQYHLCEMHGFEVDLSGRVIVPEFCPDPDVPLRIRASLDFAASVFAAVEKARPVGGQ